MIHISVHKMFIVYHQIQKPHNVQDFINIGSRFTIRIEYYCLGTYFNEKCNFYGYLKYGGGPKWDNYENNPFLLDNCIKGT